jgi:hypothetical protein
MNKNLFRSVILGSTFACLAMVAPSASAVTLTPVTETFAFDPANGWTIDATAQGRAGVLGAGDWELGGFNDTIPGGATFSQAQWVWGDRQEVSWLLDVDKTTDLATFKMWALNPSLGTTITRTINLEASGGFNGFGIVASSDGRDSGKVAPGTEISLLVNKINGLNLGTQAFTTNAIAPSGGVDKEANYFALSDTSYSLGGTLFMDWNTINPQAKSARSRVQFEVKIFDRPPQSVPEPSALLGLLSLSGVAFIKKRI